MTSPSIIQAQDSGAWGISYDRLGLDNQFSGIESIHLAIPGTSPNEFALWNGHQFETIRGSVLLEGLGTEKATAYAVFASDPPDLAEAWWKFYYPIDPRIRHDDVLNATVAHLSLIHI